jgi:hypothetical protein
VSYEYDGELGPITFCHCSNCRKFSGTAFATGASIQSAALKILTGEEAIKEYESSPGVFRAFCGNCSSPLYTRRPSRPETLRLRLGSLDTSIEERPAQHIFVSEKADWFEISDDLPQHETVAPA